jgi:nitroreductase
VNRGEGTFGKTGRTDASASNSREIDLYVAMSEDAYLDGAVPRIFTPVASGGFRHLASYRGMARAPLSIIYVVYLSRYDTSERQPDPFMGDPEVQKSYHYTDTGMIAQNIYLFAASRGLVAWFHNCEREQVAETFNLRPDQRALFRQSVGYPSKS